MADITPQMEACSLVILGRFNPAIITAPWLARHGLLNEAESIDLVSVTTVPQFSQFETGWLLCQTTDERLIMQSTDPLEYDHVRDVFVGVLSILPETPVASMGINRSYHIQIDSLDSWHALGDKLVPKEPWEKILNLAGMRSVTLEGERTDAYHGAIHVKVEPSVLIERGVFIEVNDHYVLERRSVVPTTRADFLLEGTQLNPTEFEPSADRIPIANEIVDGNWYESLARADGIVERVIGLARS